YDAVISVNNPEKKLRPGMTANVSIITDQRTNSLRIPNGALRFRPPEVEEAMKEAAAQAAADNPQRGRGQGGGGGGAGGGGGGPGGGGGGGGPGGGGGGGGGGRRGGGGGGGGGDSGPRRPRAERSEHTIYLLEKTPEGKSKAKPVQVRTGISDG